MKELRIDIARTAPLSPVERYAEILLLLTAEGFRFTECEDLFPATFDLVQPYEVRLEGHQVVFRQG